VLAVTITMETLEVFRVTQRDEVSVAVARTGPMAFGISPESPGFHWLVRLLITPPEGLGCVQGCLPEIDELGGVSLSLRQPIRLCTRNGLDGCVYLADLGGRDAVLKLMYSEHEASAASLRSFRSV
jgi:hypothetical protein